MNILVFEDEIIAKEKIFTLINKLIPDANICGWARSIKEALYLLETTNDIDLIYSDIKLLDGNAFAIYDQVDIKCPIIFCSAYNQYLMKAFHTSGIAYLLKPYNEEQFSATLQKYYKLFENQSGSLLSSEQAQQLYNVVENNFKKYKARFPIKKKDGIYLLQTQDVICFLAFGGFSIAIDQKSNRHTINMPITEIEGILDPSLFFRINRSEIININHIESIENHFKNRLVIKLKGYTESLLTSSSKTATFREWLDN